MMDVLDWIENRSYGSSGEEAKKAWDRVHALISAARDLYEIDQVEPSQWKCLFDAYTACEDNS